MTTRLEAIRAREQAATKGPWYSARDEFADLDDLVDGVNAALRRGHLHFYSVLAGITEAAARTRAEEVGRNNDGGYIFPATTGNGPNAGYNADFIAHARTDIPALLAVVDAVLDLPKCPFCTQDILSTDAALWNHQKYCPLRPLVEPTAPTEAPEQAPHTTTA